MTQKPVLLIGGAGHSGAQTARLLRRLHPDLPLAIGSRTPAATQSLAAELGGTVATAVDLDAPSLDLNGGDFSAVAVFVKDATLSAMDFAGRHGLPYVSLSSGAFEIGPELAHGRHAGRSAPVVLASHWLAGALTMPALWLAERFSEVDEIRAGVLVDPQDARSGPATAADFLRINEACHSRLARSNGRYDWIGGDAARRDYAGVGGHARQGSVAVAYDILSLGPIASEVQILEEFGMSESRRSGGPPADEIVLELAGRDLEGQALTVRLTVTAAKPETFLTPLSVAILLERLLGLVEGPPPGPGVHFPPDVVRSGYFVQRMLAAGATFHEE